MSARAAPEVDRGLRRTRVQLEGTIQGVGFRPYVYRLAGELRLAGFVFNDPSGVQLEVEGPAAAVEEFLSRLPADAPALAEIEGLLTEERRPTGAAGFAILPSPREGVAEAPVTPDTATCPACLEELFDRANRRHRYPFINCTNCGPRFTIVRGVPYDRALTTMSGFEMCQRCRAEYEDPSDRRFHAQPNACPQCGPSLSLVRAGPGRAVAGAGRGDARGEHALRAVARALCEGQIVAVKGLGGFHLACRADDERAVAALRARKHREDKPFALMVSSLEEAASLVRLTDLERELMSAPQSPIVLAPRRPRARVAPSVAPGAPELGVMLAYTPLHHLLLADLGELERGARPALVMTSGNISQEPIAFRDEEACSRLGAIAAVALVHDRSIQTRTDDSVVRAVRGATGPRRMFVRRSRGYVPTSLPLPCDAAPPLLACGAELKNTFCLAKSGRAWVGHHVGDLETYETLSSFLEGIEHFKRLFAVEPVLVVHDLHPEYLSSKYALECEGVELLAVQHHHAHLAACLAEHGETGPAVGAIFDGSGYGTDATVWGGELLVGGLSDFDRAGMLLPVRLPGGERAIREPWRMACAWLAVAADAREQGEENRSIPRALRASVSALRWRQVGELVRTGVNSPWTTSVGRLFDAVAALCGLRPEVNYEGQAAIELEAACDPLERGTYPISLAGPDPASERLVIDPRETIRAVVSDVDAGVPTGSIASRFHAALAGATVEACARAASSRGTEIVVLGGGVFQNRRLTEAVEAGLCARGLRVLAPERLPPGDGGISYGQAAVAAWRATR